MHESHSLGLLASRAEKEWRARMQESGVRIPDGVTASRLFHAAGQWMRDELSYFSRQEGDAPIGNAGVDQLKSYDAAYIGNSGEK